MKLSLKLFALLCSLSLTGCTYIMENMPGVYKIDVQQGNIINQEIIDQLRPNMTKRQVLYVMGSSMLMDVFHRQRWDYVYSEQPGGEPRVQKRVSLYFDGDLLKSVQGDFRPSSLPVEWVSKDSTVEVPQREFEKTLWEMITGLFDDEAEVVQEELIAEVEEEELAEDEESEGWWVFW